MIGFFASAIAIPDTLTRVPLHQASATTATPLTTGTQIASASITSASITSAAVASSNSSEATARPK